MTEMFGEAWPPMSVPDLAPDDDDDDTCHICQKRKKVLFYYGSFPFDWSLPLHFKI